jgi:hypothetical protein
MRRALALACLAAAVAGAPLAFASTAEAQTRREQRPVVTITPSYLTAGRLVSEGETRAAIPYADARFRSTGYDIPGDGLTRFRADPWHLGGGARAGFSFDSPFGRKLPGEQ